jgi:pimeloyl-ACP methyl ester carboxylesterase
MTPSKAAQPLADTIADCRRVVLPATGHMMTLERPDEVLDVMRDFLKGIG